MHFSGTNWGAFGFLSAIVLFLASACSENASLNQATAAGAIQSSIVPIVSLRDARPNRKNTSAIDVMVTIRPLALIAHDLVGSEMRAESLVQSNNNPHFYQIKPSDVVKLKASSNFFWVGPQLESYLPRLLESHRINQFRLDQVDPALAQVANPHTEGPDAHLWLDPVLAISMAELMAGALGTSYPQKKRYIEERLSHFRQGIEAMLLQQKNRFSLPNDAVIISRHDAYSRLAKRVGFTIADYVSKTPEVKPGLAKLAQIQREIAKASRSCFLKDNNTSDTYAKKFAARSRVVELDILALNTPLDAGYVNYITALLDKIYLCIYFRTPT